MLAIGGAVAFQIDALSLFGVQNAGVVGYVLTGLLASGGSNYVHNRLRHISEVTIEEVIEMDDGDQDSR